MAPQNIDEWVKWNLGKAAVLLNDDWTGHVTV